MVSVHQVRASNERIHSVLGRGLVAVFAGATSGIGETTLREFARYAAAPRVYFIGQSKEAGERIAAECKTINPEGTFHFIQSDLSLIRNVDKICQDIKAKEQHINLLWLSQGTLVQGIKTDEGLNKIVAVMYFSRFRFISNLLPLMRRSPGLKRVVSCLAGGKEGPMMLDDFQGWKVPANQVHSSRGHIASATTLGMERFAKQAPEVSFIHDFPGLVRSGIARGTGGGMLSLRLILMAMYPFGAMNTKECGERHVFLMTSARYPATAGDDAGNGVPIEGAVSVAEGTDTRIGSGMYTVDQYLEQSDVAALEVLRKLRSEGATDYTWEQTHGEFLRITGVTAV